jgi:hypothetical protein
MPSKQNNYHIMDCARRMLDMFRRPDDPDEHNYLYVLPAAAMLALYAAGVYFQARCCCVSARIMLHITPLQAGSVRMR